MSTNIDRVATFARELGEMIAQDLQTQLGTPRARAEEIAAATAQRFCDEYAGQIIYVPMGIALRIDARDHEMYDEYCRGGRNAGAVAAVAKKFKVCLQTAYKRISMVETALFKERQGALFGDED